MIAEKAPENPVFKTVAGKRKRMLAAVFAAAACAAGVLIGVSKNDEIKVSVAGLAILVSIFAGMSRPQLRSLNRAIIPDEMGLEILPPTHPYKVMLDGALESSGYRDRAHIYRGRHEGVVYTGPFSMMGDIYFSEQYEQVMNNEAHMQCVIAHEAGHIQDGMPIDKIEKFCNTMIGSSAFLIPIMAVTAPIPMPLKVGCVAISTVAYAFNKFAIPYIYKQGEHIADLYAMYNVKSKNCVQETLSRTVLVQDITSALFDGMEAKKEPAPNPRKRINPYVHNWGNARVLDIHPTMQQRLAVMDQAAQYMPSPG